jgi:hypothetical protein
MNRYLVGFACFVFHVLAPSQLAAQTNQEDRVVVGLDNLALTAKEHPVKDEGLKTLLRSNTLNCVIICQRAVPPKDGNPATTEYFLLYTKGRRTKFDKQVISKDDYESLLKYADRLEQKG